MKHILPIIVIAQFFCTSLWFAGNGVMSDLILIHGLGLQDLGHLTSAVQLGFITGTLIFAFLSLADRFPPSKVFFICALTGAVFNLGMILNSNSFESMLLWRFLTGFSLAGIYPVGMKIASDYYREGLGRSLGFLVGALVLGTALPHLLKTFFWSEGLPWKIVIYATSGFAILGGFLIILFVPEGPYRKMRVEKDFYAIFRVFKNAKFRSAAFGYFGHMWELYTFWALVPVMLSVFTALHPDIFLNIPLLSFFIIGLGSVACVAGGFIAEKFGAKSTATTALLLSGFCCLIAPLLFFQDSAKMLIGFLIFWGLVVVADSPLFSTLVAQNSNPETRGTALTIVNSIGFAITIISLQLISYLFIYTEPVYLLPVLAIGPLIGIYSLINGK